MRDFRAGRFKRLKNEVRSFFLLPASWQATGPSSSCAPPFKNAAPFFLLRDHPVYQRSSRLRLAHILRKHKQDAMSVAQCDAGSAQTPRRSAEGEEIPHRNRRQSPTNTGLPYTLMELQPRHRPKNCCVGATDDLRHQQRHTRTNVKT